jgi:hypothetical protein
MKSESKYVDIELYQGIIIAKYKPIYIDINIAKSVMITRNEFTDSHSYPMLLDCSSLKGIDKESRDFFSLPNGSNGLKATAMIVKSRLDSFFVNFLLKVNLYKSELPIKVFNNYEDALKWLENYK